MGAEKDKFTGRVIGGCHVIAPIGRGAMAAVYKAEQLSLDRMVALKLLDDYSLADQETLPRFFREARSAARILHPNVVQVYDVGVDQGVPYLIMELVDGETAYDRLKREGKLKPADALEIVRQAALALVRAQEFDIIHRDIKPANIMLSVRGEVKLADFGLAKAMGDCSVTRTGEMALGTPYYMSPEQADASPLDVRSDIYSLGATFYHLATGQPPFQGPSTADILVAHVSTPLKPACEVEPSIPADMSALIDKMMAKSPADRFPSARALLSAISGIKRALAEDGVDETEKPTKVAPSRRRNYRRVAADFVADIRRVTGTREQLEAISSRVKNLSGGGLFVETDKLMPVGSVIEVRFRLGPKLAPIRVLGVVRWTASGPGAPGMGVEFVEIDSKASETVQGFVDERRASATQRDLSRTPLHVALLRLHSRLQGDARRLNDIAKELSSTQGLLRLVLRTFEEHGLIAVDGDIVQFLAPERDDLREVIAVILAEGAGPIRPPS